MVLTVKGALVHVVGPTPGRTKVQDIDLGASGQSNVPVEGTWVAVPRILKATYDFSVDGGAVSNINLSTLIPDKCYYYWRTY